MGRSPRFVARATIVALFVVSCFAGTTEMAWAAEPGSAPIYVEQGSEWTTDRRNEFYTLDQGSRLMPLRWFMALKLPDGSAFIADGLRRYGYLPSDAVQHKLPVGFSVAGDPGNEMVGMTCAACHTRQIEVNGAAYRIDGGPALVDFQSMLSDLDMSVGKLLRDETAFADFAHAVLHPDSNAAEPASDESDLREKLGWWYKRFNTLMSISLPPTPWGVGRLDAVGMIFNRLTGLDLGPSPYFIIEANIKRADAPVRYPFLWNAAKQEVTQWPGIAANSDDFFREVRNIAQVFGVFAEFRPKKDPSIPDLGVDYLAHNSVNIEGIKRLETLMTKIGPPRWPWALDETLAKSGKEIYRRAKCDECHRAEPSGDSWETRIEDVGSDSRELDMIESAIAQSGELEGAGGFGGPLKSVEPSLDLLKITAVGTAFLADKANTKSAVAERDAPRTFRAERNNRAFLLKSRGYEARVLHGVWAAAPYLHNGSVPTLADLLKPASERPVSFKIGPAYDPVAVGLAVEQSGLSTVLETTDCSDRGSGNSRCGHEYGADLSEADRRALLEYLKIL